MNRSLRLEFLDSKGKKANITIPEPKSDITKADASAFGEFIASHKIIATKDAELDSFQKAFVLTRTEEELQ